MRCGLAARRRPSAVHVVLPLLLLGLLAACAARPDRPEIPVPAAEAAGHSLQRVPRSDPGIVEIAPGWIRHPVLGVLPVERVTRDAYIVRIAAAATTPAVRTPPADLQRTEPRMPTLHARGELVEMDNGLPRAGQWRDGFVLRDLGGGRQELLAPPPRKTLGVPQRWVASADGWSRLPLPLPAGSYDYGSAASGDFDADGRADLALAMHLHGFAALLARDGQPWQDAAAGLPTSAADAPLHGSGVGVAVLPQRGGDRLLLLREASGRRGAADAQAPGLAEYRWDGRRWHAEPIAPRLLGSGLALATTPRCPPLLAVKAAANNHLPLFERTDGRWTVLAPPLHETATWYTSAIDAGDFDGRGCADLAVARRVRGAQGWSSSVDLLLDGGGEAWTRIGIEQHRRDRQVTALHGASAGNGAVDLLLGRDDGSLDRYLVDGRQVQWIAHAPAPPWRAGCAVADIERLTVADGTPHWLVAFAGENDLLDPRRCRGGGGLAEFRWRATEAADQSPD